MSDKQIQLVVAAFAEQAKSGSKVGARSRRLVQSRLSGIKAPKARREAREAAIRDIVDSVSRAGYSTTTAEIGRLIKFNAVENLLGISETPVRKLRALAPLVQRKDEIFNLRKPERAKELAARVSDLTPDQITTAVNVILNRKPREKKPKLPARDKVAKLIVGLDVEDQRAIYAALKKRFAEPRQSPIPDPQPTSVEMQREQPAGLVERLRRRAG